MKRKKKKVNNLAYTIGCWIFLAYLYLKAKYSDFFENLSPTVTIIVPVVIVILTILLFSGLKKALAKKKYLNSSLSQIDRMKGTEFEKYLKAHFEQMGYKVDLTPVSADYGVDLILTKNGEKIAVQAKRYHQKVSIAAIQEVVAGMNYYNCDKAAVITNSYFTHNARELAEKNKVLLWDRDFLLNNFKIGKMDLKF